MKCNFEVVDDLIDNPMVFDEGDNPQPSSAGRKEQWINFINVLSPLFSVIIFTIILRKCLSK